MRPWARCSGAGDLGARGGRARSVWSCARLSARVTLGLGARRFGFFLGGTARGHDQVHVPYKFYYLNINQ